MRVVLTSLAQKDLRSIYRYSKVFFGNQQAFDYVKGLRSTIALLKDHAFLGRSDDAVSKNLHRLVYRQSIIYYSVTGQDVIVRRVLDARQDPLRHL